MCEALERVFAYPTVPLNLLVHSPSHLVGRCKSHPGPIFIFMLSALVCMSCSTLYHLFNAHSEKVHLVTARLDYAGISILICGSYYPGIYYLYFCYPGER